MRRSPRRAPFGLASLFAALACVSPALAQATLEAPAFVRPERRSAEAEEADVELVSHNGCFDLAWTVSDSTRAAVDDGVLAFEIEEVVDSEVPQLFDAGPFTEAALSGRDDGHHRYRVRAVEIDRDDGDEQAIGPWSEPFEVRVEHHSLALTFTLFGIGFVVFVATAGVILVGQRRVSA